MTILAFLAGPSALFAAGATVVGAVTLGLFFSKGEPWGTRNDVASIVLMVATLPVVFGIALLQSDSFPASVLVAMVGVIGMVGTAVAQGLLVARRWKYEELLPWTLGFAAVVGLWYTGVGLLGLPVSDGGVLAVLAIAAGLGYVAIAEGFRRGSERHPLSIVGGLAVLVASTWFLVWLGLDIVTGRIGFGSIE